MKKLLILVPLLLLAASLSFAQVTSVPTTTLTVTVGAEAAIVVGTTPGFSLSTTFAPYTASTPYTYYIRTSSGGTGNISVKFVNDWSPGGGPSITSSGTTGDYLSFTPSVTSPGTAAGKSNCAALNNAYPVATFVGSASSAIGGNTGSVAWSLVNDPAYAQGSYSITATFTISAS
jgi:hypothetical protein